VGEIGYSKQRCRAAGKPLVARRRRAVQENARFVGKIGYLEQRCRAAPECPAAQSRSGVRKIQIMLWRKLSARTALPFCLGREADNGVNRHGRESPFPKVRLQWRNYEPDKIVKRSRLNKDQLPVAHFGMTMTGDPLATLSVDFAQMLREHLICGIGTPPAFSGPLPLSDCSKRCPLNVGVGGHLN
jgi:hypothetical protein